MRQLSATYAFLFKKAKPSTRSSQAAESNAMTSTQVAVPGEPTGTGTALLDTTTAAVQGFQPINKIHLHQCAYHFYADDMTRQVEAHHFCAHQNEDMRQCLIYDGEGSKANLIGVEYMVPEQLFLALSDEEKRLWHSHEYEVKSGMLFMPRVPGPVERQEMEQVCKTYGKTFHFWQVDRGDRLPLGVASLMMAFTADGQLREGFAKDVERRYGVSFEKEGEKRAYMKGPDHGIHPLANGASKGLRLELREVELPRVSCVPRAFV